ncbi:MAG: DNA topoisomerase IV [Candidatus Marinimicrobia bacterium]|nr:DNA topoisomerase IV [Candidatus Neomarinimicrobiota bacterium]|tara:strand:- start:1294 stop:3135 length:1842 start_codon:yes stop_codon:yes gene_type:complete
MSKHNNYTESSIKSLDWNEHIRTRPGMYIGKLGDGSSPDDGIYVLLKEVIDNSIDEFVMGHGKRIQINVSNGKVVIRDYGRGIPLGKLLDCVTKINTGAKYDSKVFKKSVGLNGVGIKAVNALSEKFIAEAIRDGEVKKIICNRGSVIEDCSIEKTTNRNGTKITFHPDNDIFKNYNFLSDFVENKIWNYAYLNSGLTIELNSKKYFSENGLLDLLDKKTENINLRYPIIHLKDDDIEIAVSHTNNYNEEYYSFVNGQLTTQGGTHLSAFKEAFVRAVREFFKKDFDVADIRASMIAALSIRVEEPVFESQTKTKLGSLEISPNGKTIKTFTNDFMKSKLDNFFHKNPEVADQLLARIIQSEKERKEMQGIKKLASKRSKTAKLHNKKLRDCKIHLNNNKHDIDKRLKSTIFITEGDSAGGSITKIRDVSSQAVFSLRGKPLNTYGLTKKVIYENEEFNLLFNALNIDQGIENLRYNQIVIATDADVDGMHIRLLLLTFFLNFYPDIVKSGHLYILETPLFRVRNKKQTYYCYSTDERDQALSKLGGKPEITRFKGLGEISPNEFKDLINEDMKLEPVILKDDISTDKLLSYYMGKNTQDRQDFIINNLVSDG